MRAISRTASSLISPTFHTLPLHLSQSTHSRLFFPPRFLLCSFPIFKISYSYLKPLFMDTYNNHKTPSKFIENRRLQATMSPPSGSCGEIHVIVGPMFAGKTTTLLHRIQYERERGRSVVVIKSNKDVRYGSESIVTHDGAKFPCWSLANLSSFRQMFSPSAYNKLDVIGIDEAQFFDDLYDFCREASDYDGKTIIVAGLDGDYLRRKFGRVVDIIPLADSVTKLAARCELCGSHASFTLRKTSETQTELVGGADVYKPVCRKHYTSGQDVKKGGVVESRIIQFG